MAGIRGAPVEVDVLAQMVEEARMDDCLGVAPVPEVARLRACDAAPVVAVQAGIEHVLRQLGVVIEAEVVVVYPRHQRGSMRLPVTAVGRRDRVYAEEQIRPRPFVPVASWQPAVLLPERPRLVLRGPGGVQPLVPLLRGACRIDQEAAPILAPLAELLNGAPTGFGPREAVRRLQAADVAAGRAHQRVGSQIVVRAVGRLKEAPRVAALFAAHQWVGGAAQPLHARGNGERIGALRRLRQQTTPAGTDCRPVANARVAGSSGASSGTCRPSAARQAS